MVPCWTRSGLMGVSNFEQLTGWVVLYHSSLKKNFRLSYATRKYVCMYLRAAENSSIR